MDELKNEKLQEDNLPKVVLQENKLQKNMESTESLLLMKVQENSLNFIIMGIIFGVFYTFCLYKNLSGITYPVFIIGTIIMLLYVMKKLDIKCRKSAKYYIISSILIGISTVLTADPFLHFFNSVGVILLFSVFAVSQFYDDSNWNIGQYFIHLFLFWGRMIESIPLPFLHLSKYQKIRQEADNDKGRQDSAKMKETLRNVVLGCVIAIPVIMILIGILSSADMIFSKLVTESASHIFEMKLFSLNAFGIFIMAVTGFFAFYCAICAICKKELKTGSVQHGERINSTTAVTFTSLIAVLYIIFCMIQILYLFQGGFLSLPDGVTYSEYARTGFFQLLAVTMINFIMILTSLKIFQENKALKIILTIISVCTYIMIVSAFYRMFLYVGEYKLSFLRLLVIWFLCVNVLLMGGAVLSIYKKDFPLFKFILTVVTICYLVLAFGRPSYLVAVYNIHGSDNLTVEDMDYFMSTLSMDAVPVLEKAMEERFQEIQTQRYEELMDSYSAFINETYKSKGIREFNLAWYQAKKCTEE